ncbi:hypothetical protein KEM48_010138 [Puccinia striiformis f. sp. tritici PST-130]|nr:hypothetical protein KEM48_010138 [Puccinia striiformis f. sp. tritici PST-130]
MKEFRHPVYSASLANRASAHMAEGQYQLASEDLEEAISRFDPVMTKKNRSTLITRVFRLVRCYLALLDGRRARCALRKLGVQFSPDEPDSSEYKTLCSRIKLLIAAEKSIEHSRSTDQNWQMAFQLIQSMEKEIMSWGPKFDLALLPGSWTCWKIESLAHLGKTVEAEEVLDQCSKADSSKVNTIKHPGMKSEYQIARAWVDLAKADLSTRVYDALRYAHPAPAGRASMSVLMSSMEEIERSCSQSSHLQAIGQCADLLLLLKDPMFTTLNMKVETIRCEQLAEYGSPESYFCYQIIASNMALRSKLNFTSSKLTSKPDIYEPHRIYLVRSLIAQARSTYQSRRHDWSSTYLTISQLLNFWPDLLPRSREGIFEEIRARTNTKRSSHPHSENSFPHSSRNRSSYPNNDTDEPVDPADDPKGYYRTLAVRTKASMTEIKAAFHKLSLLHHPDKGGQVKRFQSICEAYNVLINPDRRSAYDRAGR